MKKVVINEKNNTISIEEVLKTKELVFVLKDNNIIGVIISAAGGYFIKKSTLSMGYPKIYSDIESLITDNPTYDFVTNIKI